MAFLLDDATRRDLTTARRVALLSILLNERYLTRPQLIAKVETLLGTGCVGTAWEDIFYRDMRVVKAALHAAGKQLAYSRSAQRPGYYLIGELAISEELAGAIRHSVAEIDPNQIQILRSLPVKERFRMGCSITDTAVHVAAYRLRLQQPELTPMQAQARVLQKAYQNAR